MAVIDSLGFSVDTSGLKSAQSGLIDTGNAAEGAASKAEKSMGKFRDAMDKVRSTVFSLQGAISALGVSLAFREILQANEAWTNQTNALKLVTSSSEELLDVQNKLFDLSQNTRGALSGTVDLYSRLARSTQDLGVSNDQLLVVTEAVNKSIAISGSSAESANAALFQLGQGLAAGALRGEELNSVMEQTPRLAEALADGLGVGIGQLRKLGEQGKLTSEVVIAALTNQAGAIDKEFTQTTKTVSQATTQLANEIERTLGSIDNQGLIDALDSFRTTLADPMVIQGMQSIAQGMVTAAEEAIKLASTVSDIAKEVGEGAAELIYGPIEKEAVQAQAILRDQIALVGELENTYSSYVDSRKKLVEAGVDDAQIAAFDMQIQKQGDILEREKERLRILQGINAEITTAGTSAQDAQPVGSGATVGVPDLGDDKDAQKLKDKLQKQFETLQESYASETELALQALNDKLAMLDEIENAHIGTEEERLQIRLDINSEYEDAITKIQEEEAKKRQQIAEQERKARLDITTGMLDNLAVLTASGSKTLFDIGKGAAIASATVKGYEAINAAYTAGWKTGIPGAGVAYAATAAVAVAQQIAQISGTTFEGGGTVSATGGGGVTAGGGQPAVSSVPPALAPDQQSGNAASIQIVIEGNVLGNEDFIDNYMIPGIKDAIENKDAEIISPTSRNGQALAAGG